MEASTLLTIVLSVLTGAGGVIVFLYKSKDKTDAAALLRESERADRYEKARDAAMEANRETVALLGVLARQQTEGRTACAEGLARIEKMLAAHCAQDVTP